jgi:hypothetical protein
MIFSTYNSSVSEPKATQVTKNHQLEESGLLVNSKTEQLIFEHRLKHQLVEIEHCCITERAANLLDVSVETLNRTKREGKDFYERANWIAYPVQEIDGVDFQPTKRKPNFWRVFFRVLPNEHN